MGHEIGPFVALVWDLAMVNKIEPLISSGLIPIKFSFPYNLVLKMVR